MFQVRPYDMESDKYPGLIINMLISWPYTVRIYLSVGWIKIFIVWNDLSM